ncbi:MAG: YfiR family protein [Alphaproteobacteria bacterium]|nr:YfiR family protein [Alphaproteobacteria bacterium]
MPEIRNSCKCQYERSFPEVVQIRNRVPVKPFLLQQNGKRRMFNSVLLAVGFILINLVSGLEMCNAQTSEYLVKASFIDRFIRFIKWPGDSLQTDTTKPFIILVLGKNQFGDNLNRVFANNRVNGRKVTIKYASKIDTTQCFHLIFIDGSLARNLNFILQYTRSKPIITIGDTEGFCQRGVLINFFIENNRVRFELNQSAFRMTRLQVSHILIQSARLM